MDVGYAHPDQGGGGKVSFTKPPLFFIGGRISVAAAKSQRDPENHRTVYSEFGSTSNHEAFERATPNLPPQQQHLRVEASRAGRKGKTVTIIRGFQSNPETLTSLLKQLKALCGAGGTLREDTLEIQGDHKQKILDFLQQQGYKAKGSGG